MDLDDDMILIIVGEDESPDIIRTFQEVNVKQEKEDISTNEMDASETLCNKQIVDVDIVNTIKEEPKIQLKCLETLSSDFESFLEPDQSFDVIKKHVQWLACPKISKKKKTKNDTNDKSFNVSTKKGEGKKQGQRLGRQKIFKKTKTKKLSYLDAPDTKYKSFNVTTKVIRLSGSPKKSTNKKSKKLCLSDIPETTVEHSFDETKPQKRRCGPPKRLVEDSGVSSDRPKTSIRKKSKKLCLSDVPETSVDHNFDETKPQKGRGSRPMKKLVKDSEVSSDHPKKSTKMKSKKLCLLDIPETTVDHSFDEAKQKKRRRGRPKKKLVEDSGVSSDDNIISVSKFKNIRRSFNKSPKSFVEELVMQHPELENDREALVEMLLETMRRVKPPPPPQDYFIMNNIKFECAECGHLSESEPAASRHYQEKHGPRYLVCYACGVDFRSTTNLYKHEKRCVALDADVVLRARARFLGSRGRARPFMQPTVKVDKPKVPTKPKKREKYPCSLCSAVFLSRTGIDAHMNYHMGRRPFLCNLCSKGYTSHSAFSKHYQKHSGRQYICDHCQRSFKVREAIIAHMNTHKPQRKFPCAECPQRFAQRAALNLHVLRVHRCLPLPCACALCPRRYPRMSLLKKHMVREHGLDIITRKMFFKKLPLMTETHVKEAKVIAKADLDDLLSNHETLDQADPSTEELGQDVNMEAEYTQEEIQDSTYRVTVLKRNGVEIKILKKET